MTFTPPEVSPVSFFKKYFTLKGHFTSKSRGHFFLSCIAFYPSWLFWCDVQSFGDISLRDVCPLLDILEKEQLLVLKAPKTFIWKSVGSILMAVTYQLYHCVEGSVHLLMDWRLANITAHPRRMPLHPTMLRAKVSYPWVDTRLLLSGETVLCGRKNVLPTRLTKGLWINLSNRVMIFWKETLLLTLWNDLFLALWAPQTSSILERGQTYVELGTIEIALRSTQGSTHFISWLESSISWLVKSSAPLIGRNKSLQSHRPLWNSLDMIHDVWKRPWMSEKQLWRHWELHNFTVNE